MDLKWSIIFRRYKQNREIYGEKGLGQLSLNIRSTMKRDSMNFEHRGICSCSYKTKYR